MCKEDYETLERIAFEYEAAEVLRERRPEELEAEKAEIDGILAKGWPADWSLESSLGKALAAIWKDVPSTRLEKAAEKKRVD